MPGPRRNLKYLWFCHRAEKLHELTGLEATTAASLSAYLGFASIQISQPTRQRGAAFQGVT